MTQVESQPPQQWNVSLPISVVDLMSMISQLPPSAKYQLRDFLDDELEEEDSPEDLAEIRKAYAEYESGQSITFDEYLTKRGIAL
jgi:hypothetical protein